VYCLEAGSIVLANNGICYLGEYVIPHQTGLFQKSNKVIEHYDSVCDIMKGNILNYSKKDLQSLINSLQSDKIQINQNDQQYDFHLNEICLNCNLWAYYDLNFNKQNSTANPSISNTHLLPSPLIEFVVHLILLYLPPPLNIGYSNKLFCFFFDKSFWNCELQRI
jgi:hypothetical protein